MLEAVDLKRDEPPTENKQRFSYKRGKPPMPKQRHWAGFDSEDGLSGR